MRGDCLLGIGSATQHERTEERQRRRFSECVVAVVRGNIREFLHTIKAVLELII